MEALAALDEEVADLLDEDVAFATLLPAFFFFFFSCVGMPASLFLWLLLVGLSGVPLVFILSYRL